MLLLCVFVLCGMLFASSLFQADAACLSEPIEAQEKQPFDQGLLGHALIGILSLSM